MTVKRFRKKPVVIEAVQYDSGYTVDGDLAELGLTNHKHTSTGIVIPTLEGEHLASHGDWIIKGIAGEFYPCKPEIFAATYDLVDDDSQHPGY